MTNNELNKLAAERVMEWELPKDLKYFFVTWEKDEKPVKEDMDWNPCENIADAWLLVEKMVNKKLSISVRSDKGISFCSVHKEISEDKWMQSLASVSADTAPLAITKACLKAVGENV